MSQDYVQHPYGKPENILKFSPNNKVENYLEPLIRLLQHKDVKNRKIVVFSIIGAYRRGKSFFLDYCLRYLYANYSSINCPNYYSYNSCDWLGKEDESLAGFSWRSGSIRDTTGIIIWNDVFLHTDNYTDEDIAIIMMDTQGLFDNETTPIDNSRIFALGTLISSIQVLNLSGVIQEDQLQYLQFATEFAKLAVKNCHSITEKPFQNLMFLIRDWQNNDEFPFGIEGGEEYLNKILQIKSNQSQDLKSVRRFIQTSFDELNCSLLPYPGRTVAEGVRRGIKYNGNWGGMNEDFKDELQKTIECLLEPEKLNKWKKKINEKFVNGSEFLEYIKLYFKFMQSDQLPKVQTIYESIIEKEIDGLVNACVQKYMDIVSNNKSVITCVEHISTIHDSSKNQAICMYIEAKKMGDLKHETKFRKILEQKIEANYKYWRNEIEANIIKIERENKRIKEDMENKSKRELERFEKEKRVMEQKYKDELRKAQASLEEMKLTKHKEIEKLRKQVKEEQEAQAREFRIEKLKAKREMEIIRAKNEAEVAELKHQLERQKEALEEQVEYQRMGRDLQLGSFEDRDISSTFHEIDRHFQNFHMEMSQGSSRLFFGMRMENYSDSDSD